MVGGGDEAGFGGGQGVEPRQGAGASHDHASGGEGISNGAAWMHNGGGEDVGGEGVTGARVDGVDDFLAAEEAEVSVIARSGYGAVEQ